MRMHVLSDLHLEFGAIELPDVAADIVVLAGDIATGVRGVEWAAARWRDRLVLYVPGNHEFYGHSNPRLLRKLVERADGTSVHVLADRSVILKGVRFLGATLWTDFRLFGDPVRAAAAAQEVMVDYRRIRVDPRFRRLRPDDTVMWHRASVDWLRAALEEWRVVPQVVITHHAPSARSLNPAYGDLVGAAYASDLDHLVAGSGARYWIHGHTHHCVRYSLGNTEVVSNQRGYPDELVQGFDPGLVLDV